MVSWLSPTYQSEANHILDENWWPHITILASLFSSLYQANSLNSTHVVQPCDNWVCLMINYRWWISYMVNCVMTTWHKPLYGWEVHVNLLCVCVKHVYYSNRVMHGHVSTHLYFGDRCACGFHLSTPTYQQKTLHHGGPWRPPAVKRLAGSHDDVINSKEQW